MDKLLHEMGIRPAEDFSTVLQAAWHVQQMADAGEHLVTRSALLYAAYLTSGIVREALHSNGFDRRIYEKELGIRPDKLDVRAEAPLEVPVDDEALRKGLAWYRHIAGERPFDYAALAAVLLNQGEGRLPQRLKSARLQTGKAVQYLTNVLIAVDVDIDYGPYELVNQFELTGAAAKVMKDAALLRPEVTSGLVVSVMMDRQIGEDYSGPDFLRRWVATRRGREIVESALERVRSADLRKGARHSAGQAGCPRGGTARSSGRR